MPKPKTDPKLEAWIGARKRHGLSHADVQMARELGLTPLKIANLPGAEDDAVLRARIKEMYEERFGRARPDVVVSLEYRARKHASKKRAEGVAKDAKKTAVEGAERQMEPAGPVTRRKRQSKS